MKKDQHGRALQRKSQRGPSNSKKGKTIFQRREQWKSETGWPLEPSAIISGRYCISYRAIADFLLFFLPLSTWGNFSRSWVKRAKKNKKRWISWGGKVVKIYYFKCFFSVESLRKGEGGKKTSKEIVSIITFIVVIEKVTQ